MLHVNIGVIVIAITALGYVSNFLNWRFLDYGPDPCTVLRWRPRARDIARHRMHSDRCTDPTIYGFFKPAASRPPQITPADPGGTHHLRRADCRRATLFILVNRYALGSYFTVPSFGAVYGWKIFLLVPFGLLSQINLLQWQSWVMIFLSFNSGAMLGPSMQDLKNVWPMLIVLLFFQSPTITEFGAATIIMIIVNIMIQAIAIIGVQITKHLIGNKI